jgi:hypothetical protein
MVRVRDFIETNYGNSIFVQQVPDKDFIDNLWISDISNFDIKFENITATTMKSIIF